MALPHADTRGLAQGARRSLEGLGPDEGGPVTARPAAAHAPRPLRISVLPNPADCPNPYLRLFYGALAARVALAPPLVVNDEWLRANATAIDVVHFHWPESIWRLEGDGGASPRRVAGLLAYLRLARRLGIRCIWTVHNVAPHEHRQWVDYAGCFVLAQMADLLICHSDDAARTVRRWYRPRRELVVTPIGNYAGVYPQPVERSIVLRHLGLDSGRPVVACLGDIRPYKGLDVAIDALRLLSGGVQAIIAGQPLHDREIDRQLRRGRELPEVVVMPRRLTDQEFADFAAAADVMWLPYRRVTGSSMLLAALTLGTRVIASDLPFFRAVLEGHAGAGRVVPAGDPAALAAATKELLAAPISEGRHEALALAARYDWANVIEPVAGVLDRWRSGS